MKIVGPPVWGWALVERPPMSQRSHIAISGSTAIWACSRACSEPSSSSSGNGSDASRRRARRVHSAWVSKLVQSRQLERGEVDHLVVLSRLALEAEHRLGVDTRPNESVTPWLAAVE
jgi:hypothetical protein